MNNFFCKKDIEFSKINAFFLIRLHIYRYMRKLLFAVLQWILTCTLVFSGCTSLTAQKVYWIYGEMDDRPEYSVLDDSCIHKSGSFCYNFTFENCMDKEIGSADLVLSLFDEDGEPVFAGDWILYHWEHSVLPGEVVEDCIILDSYFDFEPECPYLTDYFYAIRIEYADGTVFEDPFGRYGYS